MKELTWCVLLVLCSCGFSQSARILAVLPVAIRSHNIFTQPIARQLALRGHHVTILTPYEDPEPPPNYHQIISDSKSLWEEVPTEEEKELYLTTKPPFIIQQLERWGPMLWFTEAAFNSTSVKTFIQTDNSHYDLIITELFMQEAFLMFAHKYKAPTVMLSSFGFGHSISQQMGSPLQLSSIPFEFADFSAPLTLWQRVKNTLYTLCDLLGRILYYLPQQQILAESNFGHLQKPLPHVADLQRNVSLVLVNSHFSIDDVRATVPGIVEVGGIHIQPPKKLPKDLQKFMDDAEDGVVYFSLGTIVKSSELSPKKIEIFVKVFSQLKQRVMWKWDNDSAPIIPENIHLSKWLPQAEILSHPNTKVFITHGGLLGSQEAIYYGVPIMGMPIYGDQFLNVAKAVKFGYGLELLYKDITEETLKNTLEKLIYHASYKKHATDVSARFRDKPLTPMETAMFWIEYVLRNGGGAHMRSPILDQCWFQYLLVDVALVLMFGPIAVGIAVYCVIVVLCKLLLFRKPSKRKSNKKDD